MNNYPDEKATSLSQLKPYPSRTSIGYVVGMVHFKAVYKLWFSINLSDYKYPKLICMLLFICIEGHNYEADA